MKIQVTQADIDNGIKGSNSFCPIAQAIKRQDKNVHDVHVLYKWGDFKTVGVKDRFDFMLPIAAQTFINDFDNGKPVSPFEFEAEKFSWEQKET